MDDYYLRKWGDPVLREPCEAVEDFSQLDFLIDSMYSIMRQNLGCGIAAPQVGDSRQVLIAQIGLKSEVFVNPRIEFARGYVPFLEGCLSFPFLLVPKIRRYRIDVNYFDRYGAEKSNTFRGLNAIILQHEIDHLNGKLMFHYFL